MAELPADPVQRLESLRRRVVTAGDDSALGEWMREVEEQIASLRQGLDATYEIAARADADAFAMRPLG
jgi:hypothetical protein